MKLTIVIPALNEEDAIGATIERSLAARESIVADSPVDDVEIVVVSDGSTDRTAEIAAGYADVRLIVFEENRGYGAAIKEGFRVGTGDVVGFLDADGTCDPTFFATLCEVLIKQNAAVAIGSRMGPESHMPWIRRLGNLIYATILSAMSNKVVTDTASGMRVIRRDVLNHLYPLPDGLHFTPAMSARVLMDDRFAIAERPMPYQERIGDSKLHVLRDGVRFLRIIVEMALMWQPARVFITVAVALILGMTLLAMHPIETWMRLGYLREDMIYRLLFCSLLGAAGFTLLSTALICQQWHTLLDEDPKPQSFLWSILDRIYTLRGLATTSSVATPALLWLVGPGVWTRLIHGYVDLHWSRVVLAGLIAFGLLQQFVTVLVANLARYHTLRKPLLLAERRANAPKAALASLNTTRQCDDDVIISPP